MATKSDEAVNEALNEPIDQLKIGEASSSKLEENGRAKSNGTYGHSDSNELENGEGEMSATALKAELERMKDERDSFEEQYHGLLGKLGQMRSTLGDRLRQDAEELDRREQQIDTLNARIDGLSGSMKTLEGELVTSHEEVERLTKELDNTRSIQQQTAANSTDRKGNEMKLRELQEMAERYRIEAESWESACMEERAYREDVDLQLREAQRERDEAIAREQEQSTIAQREMQTARELQQVLEEFQAAQDSELQRAIGDHEEKIERLTTSLKEHQERTTTAEALAEEHKKGAERCQTLAKEVKEKNLLIGKLRHEAVILNEHLTESLRRLRANQSDAMVDGKLIGNLLIQFLNTPRSDSKRFEMLSLIASVLNWSPEEREKAGLQRNNQAPTPDRKGGKGGSEGHKRSGAQTNTTGEESFSNLFVEFLLSEAEKAKKPSQPISSNASGPPSPTTPKQSGRPSFNLGSLASLNRNSGDDSRVFSPGSNAATDPSGSPRKLRSP
ncbi:uncharacterized protein FA14DRAFT_162463 [Meira miltonrushii]|uniref:GRIP domain-containing protein n=1 Tax=Meira miltonrushii TaxID=1280837 RepID=A0A316V7W0_9BASI|nr:uncharacterized protein FA14DRAFT_162463 [Meira miltonrushii]PWN32293.1 hypothetical protein FA14DRAFT_162463 [Meira miltonrushii]